MKNARLWTFRVQAETQPGEVVGVTGNIPELGEWKVSENSKVVLLTKDSTTSNCDDIWTVTKLLPSNEDIYYRFFICIVVDNEKYIVKRREVSLRPRIIEKNAPSNTIDVGKIESFAKFGYFDQCYWVDKGWLTSQTLIQIKFHSHPLFFWKEKLKTRLTFIKLTPVDLTKKNNADSILAYESVDNNSLSLDTLDIGSGSSDAWPITEICVLNDSEGELSPQRQFGREIKSDDFIVFQIQVHNIENFAYLIDYYVPRSRASESEPPCHIGFSYILPSAMTSSEGRIIVPVTSTKHQPIGQISADYLVIKPIENYTCDMSTSYAKYWKHSLQGLDVGHRGLGTSFKQKSCAAGVRENTIASLKEAASHGADYVEFDVQLSKDMVPVIYHDFHVCISLKRKKVNIDDMLEIPLKELTLEQLQCLKVYHIQEGIINKQLFFDEHLEDHQPFPTLKHALNVLDPIVGFNIEIKWTMLLKDGTFELNNPFDLNTYVDSILKVVLENGGNRKIIFSCFHPDICTMVRHKQTKYPVMFLTQGVTSKYPMYHDPRCHTIEAAVYFAQSLGILGINVHTEDILRNPKQLSFAKDRGLIVFCWGDDNNDAETIKYLKELGLHAKLKETNLFVSEAKEHQKQLLEVADHIHSPSSNGDPSSPSSVSH
ncbi:conserved hypothetical protein [Pediculus humanus corporis]|uniref:Glycerophosphocholine phosphodiesterase n=1 Tax=Pediculus humanus subsp. corporis TaxID=121224 RepID=E0VJT1_PEDHC|nr:uncharacterized protein Phum_PHUM249710 [Pediculus humanus corporis]EEB13637.1 conserved hypothetical protein [Pediculus humanus corporis]